MQVHGRAPRRGLLIAVSGRRHAHLIRQTDVQIDRQQDKPMDRHTQRSAGGACMGKYVQGCKQGIWGSEQGGGYVQSYKQSAGSVTSACTTACMHKLLSISQATACLATLMLTKTDSCHGFPRTPYCVRWLHRVKDNVSNDGES